MNPLLQARKNQLANDPKNRLKWRVLWEFGALPTEKLAKSLDDDSLVDCALHMILDREGNRPPLVENPNFNMEAFLKQREVQSHGTE